MNKKIVEQWKNGYTLWFDNITFADGRIIPLYVERSYESHDPSIQHISIQPIAQISLDDVLNINKDPWSGVHADTKWDTQDARCDEDASQTYRAQCGGGAHGSTGFVGLADAVSHAYIWVAHFQWSEQFHTIAFEKEKIVAHTKTATWSFLLNAPEHIDIQQKK
jgi:hypothetical protein